VGALHPIPGGVSCKPEDSGACSHVVGRTAPDGSLYTNVCDCASAAGPTCLSGTQLRNKDDFDFIGGDVYDWSPFSKTCLKKTPVFMPAPVSVGTGDCYPCQLGTNDPNNLCVGGCGGSKCCSGTQGPHQMSCQCEQSMLNLGASAPPRLQTGAFTEGSIPLY